MQVPEKRRNLADSPVVIGLEFFYGNLRMQSLSMEQYTICSFEWLISLVLYDPEILYDQSTV